MYCTNCGREKKDGDLFCGGCGRNLKQMEMQTMNSCVTPIIQPAVQTKKSNAWWIILIVIVALIPIVLFIFSIFFSIINLNDTYEEYDEYTYYNTYDKFEEQRYSRYYYINNIVNVGTMYKANDIAYKICDISKDTPINKVAEDTITYCDSQLYRESFNNYETYLKDNEGFSDYNITNYDKALYKVFNDGYNGRYTLIVEMDINNFKVIYTVVRNTNHMEDEDYNI